MKMSNFGSIIVITMLVIAFSYFLVGGSILTLEDPQEGGTVITVQPTLAPVPTQPTDATGVPASISVKVGCSQKATVTFQFSLTNPQSPTRNINVLFPPSDKIPNAAITLAGGTTKIIDTGKAALASGPLYFDGLPDGRGPKNFPSRVCAIPTPTPV